MTGKELINGKFDYQEIQDKEVRGKLIAIEGVINRHITTARRSMLEIGKELAEAQDMFANYHQGTFVKWIEKSFPLSVRTAYKMISASKVFGSFESSSKLEDTAMYVLATPETPKLAVNAAMKLADQGEIVTAKIAEQLVEKYTTTKPAASKDTHAQDRHATAATENGTDARGGDPIREDEEDPDSCLDSGLPHKWISDGNGDRYCETCKVDHPDNDVRPDPRETAAKHLTGIAATLVQARINFDAVCQDLGSRPATYDQIMSDADKALVSIRRWAKELVA